MESKYNKRYDWCELQKHYDNNGTYKTLTKTFGVSTSCIAKAVKRGDLVTRGKSESIKLSNKLYPRKLSEETKKKISKSRIKYLKENPDKVPYLLNHSSNESYPEKYFTKVFKNEGVEVNKHFQLSLYQLDFAILDKKIDIEIDGDQHYLDPKIVISDKKRTKYLENLGWDIIRVKWSDYQKMDKKSKKGYVQDLIKYINDISKAKPSITYVDNINKCECGKRIYYMSKMCIKCLAIKNRKVKIRPTYVELKRKVENSSYAAVGREYKVLGSTIRKWLKSYENK